MPLFPSSNRPGATDGKPPKLQGADLEAHNQQQEAEAPVLDPETEKPITQQELTKGVELNDEDEHTKPDRLSGRVAF